MLFILFAKQNIKEKLENTLKGKRRRCIKKGNKEGGFDLLLLFVNKVGTDLMSEALPQTVPFKNRTKGQPCHGGLETKGGDEYHRLCVRVHAFQVTCPPGTCVG